MGIELKPLNFNDIIDFKCGYDTMDTFIQCSLEKSTLYNFCKAYGLYITDCNELIAIVAISFGNLYLGEDYIADLLDGFSNSEMIDIEDDYKELFRSKSKYPSMEISYLAVNSKYQGQGYGSSILDAIEEKSKSQELAGVQFLTLDAVCTSDYSSVDFYTKCGFTRCSDSVIHDTIRMYRPIL